MVGHQVGELRLRVAHGGEVEVELVVVVVPEASRELLQVSGDRVEHALAELQPLRRGEIILPLLGAANADPARFASPEKLDLARQPNPQVAFGAGIHFCLGAQLARVEAQVGLNRIFSRFPELSLAVPEARLKYTGRIGMRALVTLPVRLNSERKP